MIAARPMVACRAPAATVPSPRTARSRLSPDWSRVRSRLRPRAQGLTPEAASQCRPGRTMPAQIPRISPTDSRSMRCRARTPRVSIQAAQSCFQSLPVSSAPLASHRFCHVPPGWETSQSSARFTPRICPLRVPGFDAVNGGRVIRPRTASCPRRVASHSAWSGRAGNPAREASHAACRASRRSRTGAGTSPCRASCSLAVMRPRSRTARPASRAGSPQPGRARTARPLAVRSRRDGPAPGGSRPPPGVSYRSA